MSRLPSCSFDGSEGSRAARGGIAWQGRYTQLLLQLHRPLQPLWSDRLLAADGHQTQRARVREWTRPADGPGRNLREPYQPVPLPAGPGQRFTPVEEGGSGGWRELYLLCQGPGLRQRSLASAGGRWVKLWRPWHLLNRWTGTWKRDRRH